MSTVIPLGDGQSAILKDDQELTNREMKMIQRAGRIAAGVSVAMRDNLGFDETDPDTWATALAKVSDEDYDSLDLFQRTCVLIRLKSWTLDLPIPATVDEVDDLPRSIFDPLTIAATDLNFAEQFGIEGAKDPKAGTAN